MRYFIEASRNAVNVDFEQEITAEQASDFWFCYTLAEDRGCGYFIISEKEQEGKE